MLTPDLSSTSSSLSCGLEVGLPREEEEGPLRLGLGPSRLLVGLNRPLPPSRLFMPPLPPLLLPVVVLARTARRRAAAAGRAGRLLLLLRARTASPLVWHDVRDATAHCMAAVAVGRRGCVGVGMPIERVAVCSTLPKVPRQCWVQREDWTMREVRRHADLIGDGWAEQGQQAIWARPQCCLLGRSGGSPTLV